MSANHRVGQDVCVMIKAYFESGSIRNAVAKKLGLNKSKILRELSYRNGGRDYHPSQAQRFAESRQIYRKIPRKMTEAGRALIRNLPLISTGTWNRFPVDSPMKAKSLLAMKRFISFAAMRTTRGTPRKTHEDFFACFEWGGYQKSNQLYSR